MLVVDDARAAERAAGLEQLRVAARAVEQRLEARHRVEARRAAGQRVRRHQHLPIDEPELRRAAESGLVIVLAERVPLEHQRPRARRPHRGAQARRVGKPRRARAEARHRNAERERGRARHAAHPGHVRLSERHARGHDCHECHECQECPDSQGEHERSSSHLRRWEGCQSPMASPLPACLSGTVRRGSARAARARSHSRTHRGRDGEARRAPEGRTAPQPRRARQESARRVHRGAPRQTWRERRVEGSPQGSDTVDAFGRPIQGRRRLEEDREQHDAAEKDSEIKHQTGQ